MTIPPSPLTPDSRTPEQLAAIRRRGLPVALAGLICGLLGLALPLASPVSALVPPNAYAMNLAFSAMLIGAGILFYVRRTPGTRLATFFSILALLLGMAGIAFYTRQAVDSRGMRENLELANLEKIAKAANHYAATHDGKFPPDLLTLLSENLLPPQTLQSPYGTRSPTFDQFETLQRNTPDRIDLARTVDSASDYLYVGGDLKDVPPALAKDILLAASNSTVLRERLAIAFADAHTAYITVDEVADTLTTSNTARKKIGLPSLDAPKVMQQALSDRAAETKPD